MSNYVVGDIQGCYSGLRQLLDKVKFDPANDKLWAVGDLVARGPDSLDTLMFLNSLGEAFDTVLGNHDLHFLAILGQLKVAKRSDFLGPLLRSDKAQELANWLRTKPLALRINKETLISHAGLYPEWSFKKAVELSDEVSAVLAGPDYLHMLASMYGAEPNRWNEQLLGMDRLRFIINAFTRMRYLKKLNTLEFETKCAPNKFNTSLKPWFAVNNQKLKKSQRVIFGHWATLMGQTQSKQFIGLDTGFVWGNTMTLYCLESEQRISVQNTNR
ncbi:symmetrical bis(5'-nucleosyl)-tetraphosphatase [Aliiglaciecola sp. 2_MG-2023]|uniref:symmetrical bis(5'-nucleosyl)-tetraphosphatase n=1 Tax=unclassified Aliiglaciecola TaxID=2593648 RepID=UPI0026E27047|nr:MULTISPECIES: symmetrical bis(5'-nucleosyl)-tetraphosphatase [unclassified Aliiglaciecola]MDO6712632.1 symmetrical bis(5'-nucleosyl)-tetraphosphatase [Aliiglaciecola sp. 2_MG-2023]MDO6753760.1 symmetrical bis(5'-nucleosyl)-tetraphosphatase [Aliiglaciecola sp. 1_MG-2023]